MTASLSAEDAGFPESEDPSSQRTCDPQTPQTSIRRFLDMERDSGQVQRTRPRLEPQEVNPEDSQQHRSAGGPARVRRVPTRRRLEMVKGADMLEKRTLQE